VLVVGGPAQLAEVTRRALTGMPMATLVTCELRDAPTRAAELWPFAIVMSDDLYVFDSAEFDALARDVRARLITMTIDIRNPREQEQDLREKLVEAFRRRMA
jgi:hypothetical protein